MNELDVLFPSPVPVWIGERVIQVRPLPVSRIGDMLRAQWPVQELFVFGQGVEIDALLQSAQAVPMLCLGLDVSASDAAAMDADTRRAALLTVLALNMDLFFPDIPDDDAEPDPHALSDLFQRLIEAGHRWPDVQRYTLAQCRMFDDAAARGRRDRTHEALVINRAAVSDPKVFQQVLAAVGNG